jgi:hypothetical protein
MLMPFQHPDVEAYRKAAIELYETERNIASRTNSKHAVDRAIMPRLIEKRDRLRRDVAPLKAKADAYETAFYQAQVIKPETVIAALPPASRYTADNLDIPDFLRRRAV